MRVEPGLDGGQQLDVRLAYGPSPIHLRDHPDRAIPREPQGRYRHATTGDTRIVPSRALQDMTRTARSVAAALVSGSVLLAGCGLAAPKADVTPRHDTHDVSLITPGSNKSSKRQPTDRQVAIADAHHLLALVRPPRGAAPLSTTPPKGTTTIMREPPSYPGTPYLIELARYSIVPGSPSHGSRVVPAAHAGRIHGRRVEPGVRPLPGG